MIRAQSVEVDILQQSLIKAQFVGVDAHIDPRTEENSGKVNISVLNFKCRQKKAGDRFGRPLCLSNYLIHSLTLNGIPMSSAIF